MDHTREDHTPEERTQEERTQEERTLEERTIELNRPVFTEREGHEIAGLYGIDGDRLHVAWNRHTRSAPLLGSNPEVLAHVLLDALLDDVWHEAHVD